MKKKTYVIAGLVLAAVLLSGCLPGGRELHAGKHGRILLGNMARVDSPHIPDNRAVPGRSKDLRSQQQRLVVRLWFLYGNHQRIRRTLAIPERAEIETIF